MFKRERQSTVELLLSNQAAVALLGPRQIGKTTLALMMADKYPAIYLDLESPADRKKLSNATLYLEQHQDKLIILDEIQRMPDIFEVLRSIIDQRRQAGNRTGQFLILGSASIELLKQSSESLAGRIAYVELSGLTVLEIDQTQQTQDQLWTRGGFPESLMAGDDRYSVQWREDFIRTYLERDIPQLGPRIPAETLRRFWTMLAHYQGGVINLSNLATGLGISGQTVGRYLDLLVNLLLVRRLQPWVGNTAKRMVKSPKVYLRDTGLLHRLLGIDNFDALLSHPVVGASWEGFVIETLISLLPNYLPPPCFYRTAAGAEIDLVLYLPNQQIWAIEIKRSLTPTLSKGFYHGCLELKPTRQYIVYPGTESYPLSETLQVISLIALAREVRGVIDAGSK